jgi:hypothetical protein
MAGRIAMHRTAIPAAIMIILKWRAFKELVPEVVPKNPFAVSLRVSATPALR